jgi:DNA polymerase lambda
MWIGKIFCVYVSVYVQTYPRSMFAFALLYFTGSDHFNRSMRLFASKKGYSLSDKVCII